MNKILFILMLVMGCSSPQPFMPSDLHRQYCLVNVDSDKVEYIQAAIDEWNSSTFTTWQLGECQSTITQVDTIAGEPGWLAVTYAWEGDRIEFETAASGDMLRLAMLHELGHVAHLDHSDNPAAVMYAEANDPGKHLTESDLAEFNRINWH